MTDKKDHDEHLKQLIKENLISQAPPPIKPVGGLGYTPPETSIPKLPETRKKPYVPISGTELMKKWAVGWEAIFEFARQNALTPDEPERCKEFIKYDFGMLSSIYTSEDRKNYFDKWLYHPDKVNAFEEEYPDIIKQSKEKEISKIKDTPAPSQDNDKVVNFFKKEGVIWHIGFEGQKTAIKHLVGFKYIVYLIERPEKAIASIEIFHSGNPPNKAHMSKDQALAEELNIVTKSPVQAINTYQSKKILSNALDELEYKLEKSDLNLEQREELEEKKSTIKKALEEKSFRDPINSKAQVNVKKGIERARKAIEHVGMINLATYLKDKIIPDGKYGYIYTGTSWKIIM